MPDETLDASRRLFQTGATDLADGDKRVAVANARELRERLALLRELDAGTGEPGPQVLCPEVSTL